MGCDSVEESIPDDLKQRCHAVAPGNFLSFRIVATAVADWHFVNSPTAFGDLRGELGLKTKPIRSQTHALNHFSAKYLVAGFHVGEIEVRQHVGKQSQKLISHRMPEEEHPA